MQALVLNPRALLGRGRQFRAARLVELAGTRAGGFVLTRQEAAGKMGCSDLLADPHGERGMGLLISICECPNYNGLCALFPA